MRIVSRIALIVLVMGALMGTAGTAQATPVCTDGFRGGPPLSLCGGRVFPEVENSVDYVQYLPDPATGFREYRDGLEYLEQEYPRWISVFTFRELYGDDAVTLGPDRRRSYAPNDTGDGFDIHVVKITDHQVPDEGKQNLLYSLSVHGDEKGGIEGGVRTAEDLAIAAEEGGKITDGIEGYESTTGTEPEFHEYEVKDLLAKQVVYLVNFNIDGMVRGDHFAPTPGLYSRGNYNNVDLNRQMPTVGRIAPSRNPLAESEMRYGHRFMHEVAAAGVDGQMAYGADVHGEGQSRAWVDIMYPAGQFGSVKHRQLMAIAERTKSVIDESLFFGIPDMIEGETGGDAGEGIEDSGAPRNTIPTKPARWGTVWDTLNYTDTGFIGDYMAEELGVTGMDYEIALNHSDSRAYGRPWSVLLQENYVNATRAIIKTAMAYTEYQEQEFANFQIDPLGRVGYVSNPDTVTDTDENGPGTLPGPNEDGISSEGQPIPQLPYEATNQAFFTEQAPFVRGGITPVLPADIAGKRSAKTLNQFDTLVLADVPTPADAEGRAYDPATYFAALRSWVERGGNLVLTDRAIYALGSMGVVAPEAVKDVEVYLPYANFVDFEHPMLEGLRANARQLAETTLVGFEIDNNEGEESARMTVVDTAAFEGAGGHVVGTTGNYSGGTNNANQTSVGEIPLGDGQIRITGGLPMPTEENDHRYGLKDYALSYSGLYILENSIVHDAPNLGNVKGGGPKGGGGRPNQAVFVVFGLIPLGLAALRRRSRR